MLLNSIKNLLKNETISSLLLIACTVVALVWANSPLDYLQDNLVQNGLFIINDCLMTIFFFLIGRELKEGYLSGELRGTQVVLPFICAFGGMLIPAAIYLLINYSHPEAFKGWATPVATDIAFALGILSLLGQRIPRALKLFLLSLAIFDDIGAILIITFWFSEPISLLNYGFLFVGLAALCLMHTYKVKAIVPYVGIGILLWCLFYTVGIHPTLSGVIVALFLPYDARHKKFENRLNVFVGWVVLPLFALANAGISFADVSFEVITDTIVWGIIAGLFFGKQLGVFGTAWLSIKFRIGKLPYQSNWLMLYGVSILCGIGFTMSLFLGTLAFQNDGALVKVRLGVILGSFLSSIIGLLVLYLATSKPKQK